MAKKADLMAQEVVVEETVSLLDTFKAMDVAQPSLKAIAEAVGVPQQRVYSVSKQPKEGEVYDRNVYNWDAITRFVLKRLDAEVGETAEDVINRAIAIDVEYATSDKRRGPRSSTSGPKFVEGIDKNVPVRKGEYALGDKAVVKGKPEILDIVYATPTHLVLQAADGMTLTCLSNWTINQKMVRPEDLEAVIKMIEAGIYGKKEEAPEAAE